MITKEYKFGTPDSSEPQFAIVMRAGKGLECSLERRGNPFNMNEYTTVEMMVIDYNYIDSKTGDKFHCPVTLPVVLTKYLIDGEMVDLDGEYDYNRRSAYMEWDYHGSEYDGELVAYEMRIASIEKIVGYLQEDGYELYCNLEE